MDIRIENLTKKFGGQRAVDSISFEVKTGEILGIPRTQRSRKDDHHANDHQFHHTFGREH